MLLCTLGVPPPLDPLWLRTGLYIVCLCLPEWRIKLHHKLPFTVIRTVFRKSCVDHFVRQGCYVFTLCVCLSVCLSVYQRGKS